MQSRANLRVVADQRKVYSAVRNDAFELKSRSGATPEFKAMVTDKLVPELKKYLSTVDQVAAYQAAALAKLVSIFKLDDAPGANEDAAHRRVKAAKGNVEASRMLAFR